MAVEGEFEQRYAPRPPAPVQVWVYCRHCRCRIQVRTIPEPTVPFRCFCGTAGKFAQFDVFSDEDEVRSFASTFETLYQETKALMRGADMTMPRTAMYSADEMRRLLSSDEASGGGEITRVPASDQDDLETFRRTVRELNEKLRRATDLLQRHDLMGELGRHAYTHRADHPEARRLCHQVCENDLAIAREVLREATERHNRGVEVRLSFPLFKRYLNLLAEDGQLQKALEVARHVVGLGLPGYEEQLKKLEARLK